ncbi:hypothetical protein SAY86_017214 [Trapa natans]|uniref:Tubby C-terminal domain-containing protein n=1 Tax=Trapa natans TaxID=22666 RepID=A0AAN7M5W8_TRANT|nr:hypothetical protein SAY86_017214 [Trapa natans]
MPVLELQRPSHSRIIKSFQLVAVVDPSQNISSADQEKLILQFGKIAKYIFTMDYSYPLSAFQAFAICLSSFDNDAIFLDKLHSCTRIWIFSEAYLWLGMVHTFQTKLTTKKKGKKGEHAFSSYINYGRKSDARTAFRFSSSGVIAPLAPH